MIRLFFVFWKLHSKSTWLKNLREPLVSMGMTPLPETYYIIVKRGIISESESESALFAKCAQTHEEFVVVFK